MKFHMQVLIALGLGLKRNWHIFAGLVLGVLVGVWMHHHPSTILMNTLTFIGQVFIRLIQMVVIPLVRHLAALLLVAYQDYHPSTSLRHWEDSYIQSLCHSSHISTNPFDCPYNLS